jgi:hypothetical protein
LALVVGQDDERSNRLHAWPTIYVLDQKGVIRAKNVRDEAMDKVVDDLLKEMKESKTP